eukprot:m.857671 g.857671  ORF g.857671 m.857671 type:complete len:57 (+) comp23521_c0_seq12:2389-2559(+)
MASQCVLLIYRLCVNSGASVNQSEYVHSFTLVQSLRGHTNTSSFTSQSRDTRTSVK